MKGINQNLVKKIHPTLIKSIKDLKNMNKKQEVKMPRICQGCGGVLGRDCWNEMECIAIYYEASKVPDLENQVHMLTGHCEQLNQEIAQLKERNKYLENLLLTFRKSIILGLDKIYPEVESIMKREEDQ